MVLIADIDLKCREYSLNEAQMCWPSPICEDYKAPTSLSMVSPCYIETRIWSVMLSLEGNLRLVPVRFGVLPFCNALSLSKVTFLALIASGGCSHEATGLDSVLGFREEGRSNWHGAAHALNNLLSRQGLFIYSHSGIEKGQCWKNRYYTWIACGHSLPSIAVLNHFWHVWLLGYFFALKLLDKMPPKQAATFLCAYVQWIRQSIKCMQVYAFHLVP